MRKRSRRTSTKSQPKRKSHKGGLRQSVRQLWSAGRPLFRNKIAQERRYSFRPYQLKAAIRAVVLADTGAHTAIELPTGTGKTLIACLAAHLWLCLHPNARVLLIVPTRTLVVQHFEVARWLATHVRVQRIEDTHAGNPAAVRALLLRSNFIVSTPGLLARALSRSVVDDEVAASFTFVIADEFDQFVVVEEGERDTITRYSSHFTELEAVLPKAARYLIKSATLGLNDTSSAPSRRQRSRIRSNFLREELEPVVIQVPERSYAEVMPFLQVRQSIVRDRAISKLFEAIDNSIAATHARLDDIVGFDTDFDETERTAPSVCAGALAPPRSRRGAPDAAVREVFCAITKLMMMRDFVVEDLVADLKIRVGGAVIKQRNNDKVYLPEALLLSDQRRDGRYKCEPHGKFQTLLDIVAARSMRRRGAMRGVVMVRTMELVHAVVAALEQLGGLVATLHGDLVDDARRTALSRLASGRARILVMTRQTGGRGLDLPFADYAVLMSPKSGAVESWQEMSRIRSTVSNPKDVFVLTYDVAYERRKIDAVMQELARMKRLASRQYEWVSISN